MDRKEGSTKVSTISMIASAQYSSLSPFVFCLQHKEGCMPTAKQTRETADSRHMIYEEEEEEETEGV